MDRPIDRLVEFLAVKGFKEHVFEKKAGLSNAYIAKQKERKGHIGSDILDRIHKAAPELNLYWLVTGKGNMLDKLYEIGDGNDEFSANTSEVSHNTVSTNKGNVHQFVHPTVHPTSKNGKKSVDLLPAVITVDNTGKENILYVPVQARAGYLTGHGDPNFLQTLPAFNIPGLRNGTYRMFDVTGVSMAPTIADGDRVIAEYVSAFDDIMDGRVYVVVTRDGIVVKRVLNRIYQRGKLVLRSDTIAHRLEFKTYEINYEDVIEMWYCRMKLSADFSEPSEIYTKLNDLESDVVELKNVNHNLLFDLEEIKQIIHTKLK